MEAVARQPDDMESTDGRSLARTSARVARNEQSALAAKQTKFMRVGEPSKMNPSESTNQRAVRRWRKVQPQSGGWWLWREGGHARVEKMLLTTTGQTVASDDDWHQATGRKPENDGYTENYWEGTATDQKMMPGLWMQAPNGEPSEAADRKR
jgi:hypothetical protein